MQDDVPMYPTEVINGAMGALRLTNEAVAERAGVAPKTVSAVRNGDPNVGLPTLRKVVNAIDLNLVITFEKRAA